VITNSVAYPTLNLIIHDKKFNYFLSDDLLV